MRRSITLGLGRTRAAPWPTGPTEAPASARGTTPLPEPMRAAPRRMGPTAARQPDRRITRGPEPTRAAGWPTDRTARKAPRKPTTHALAPTARLDRARTCMAIGAQVKCSGAISGPRLRTRRITRPGPRHGRRRRARGGAAASRSGPAGNSVAGRTASGDLYAGHDGNVYKNDGGSWQKYDSGGWNNVQASGQLHNDWAARGEGATRSNEFSSLRSSGGWGSGSFRPSGGGFRGGGGFRRR